MKSEPETPDAGLVSHLIQVRPEPPGQFTAQAVGLPELRATAPSRDAAVQQVRALLGQSLASGQLEVVTVAPGNPLMKWFGYANPNDPSEQAYLAELERFRREDLERTLREYDQECPPSSSTPTT